ncbi:hypothetical protein QJQ45_014536 [Haematococcus lacustris]|nr:hypothetical protein QJQ45_014536 [Haematococcus lacustris]
MAAESVFIYPGGREVRLGAGAAPPPPILAPSHLPATDLPFQSLMMDPGRLAGMAAAAAATASAQPNADAIAKAESRLQAEAAAAAQAAGVAGSAMDVAELMQSNHEKLTMLKELRQLSGAEDLQALDAFLSKFSQGQPAAVVRTRSPQAVRVDTPPAEKSGAISYHGHQPAGGGDSLPAASAAAAPHYHPSFPQPSLLATHTPYQPQPPFNSDSQPVQASFDDASRIQFTDNHRPADPGPGPSRGRPASSGSQPTPSAPVTLGEVLDPTALQQRDMLPGPGLTLPSHGRRAASAGRAVPESGRPPLASSHGRAGPVLASSGMPAGEDSLDFEMRAGSLALGSSRPGTGSRPAMQRTTSFEARNGAGGFGNSRSASGRGVLADMPLPLPAAVSSRHGSAERSGRPTSVQRDAAKPASPGY